jgi:hypothetical protein
MINLEMIYWQVNTVNKNLPVFSAMHLRKGTRSEVCCKLRRIF